MAGKMKNVAVVHTLLMMLAAIPPPMFRFLGHQGSRSRELKVRLA